MKTLTLLLLSVLFVSTTGYLIKVPTVPVIQPTIAPLGWASKQKMILPLFDNICEESKNPTVVKLSQDFALDTTNDGYTQPEFMKNLLDLKSSKGLLPKNEIFTEYNVDHLNELQIIYELLYHANNFDAFFKASCWARQNINCGLFIDALYSAILHRKDMESVFIPAPYEILPNYFIRKEFAIRASALLAGDEITLNDGIRMDGNSYIVDVNYTTNVYENLDETKLVYFYEDIGLNSYYYLLKLKIATWSTTDNKVIRYGEYLYSIIKQLMARYNLERYSNGLPEIEGINWDFLNKIPLYDPMLVYSDGNDFSQRTFNNLQSSEKLTLLKSIENNIATIVSHMRAGGFNKSDILNHLMEILITSDKSYENLALEILNGDTAINNRPPSVLGHYMTTLRDPVFWAINKKMVDIVDNALKILPGYTKEELYFPGVEVLNVEVKKMMTTFDNFVFDVTDALETGVDDTNFKVKMSQSRLNHKPFSIKVNITSLVSQKGLLRVYLGPKIMPGEHALKKNLFMLLDCFEINLKYGNNVITRLSTDMSDHSGDLLSLYAIKKKIADAEFGLDSKVKMTPINEQIKFPSHLVIPKGLPEGLPLQIFVFVVPCGKALGGRLINTDINKDALLSPSFPLDLDIEVQQLFNLPNALVKDIFVVHKESDDQGTNYGGQYGGKSWQNNNYNTPTQPVILPLAARPDFTKTKEPFDYQSKRGQFGKNQDYTAKKYDYKYRKDQSLNESSTRNMDDHTTIITDKTIIPDDVTNNNKANYEYIISTEKSSDVPITSLFDKQIEGQEISEGIHIDVISNENLPLTPQLEFLTRKESFDYKSEEGQNGRKDSYSTKIVDYKYKKDAVVDKPFTRNIEEHITKVVSILPDVAKSDKDIITTERSVDTPNNLFMDKKIKEDTNNKEVQSAEMSKEKIVPDETLEDINDLLKKIIIKNEPIPIYRKIHKTIENPEEIMWKNTNYHENIFDKNNDRILQVIKSENTDDEKSFSKVDIEEIIDVPKSTLLENWHSNTKKRLSSMYDVLFNPFDDIIYGSDERVYE